MGPLLPNIKQQFFDSNGNPLSGGKLHIYEAGTSTNSTSYSDYQFTTANANPVILDSRGEADVWLTDASYKFVLKDSDDVTIYTIDNITILATTGGIVSAEYKTFSDTPITLTNADANKLFSTNVTGGDIGYTLPSIADLTLNSAWAIRIKLTDQPSDKIITISRASTDEIDGNTSITLEANNGSVLLIPNATTSPKSWATVYTNDIVNKSILMKEISAPTTPKSGSLIVYPKSDSLVYLKNDVGEEHHIAGLPINLVSKTTTYTILLNDSIVLLDDSAGDFTATLPTAVGLKGKLVTLQKTNNDTSTTTIEGDGSETVGGSANTTLNTQGETLYLVSDNVNWLILDRRIPSEWISFTPTGGWTANVTYTGRWRRVGDSMEIQFSVATSALPTPTVTASFNMVTGYAIDTAKLTATAGNAWGTSGAILLEAGQTIWCGNWTLGGTVFIVYAGRTTGRDDAVTPTTPFTFGAGDFITANATVPITGWKG